MARKQRNTTVKSREILRRLVRRFGLLLLLTLIGGGAGALYGAVKTPTYTAKAYVVAIGDPGEAISALNFAQAYGRVATSGPVLVKAAARLGGDQSGLSRVTAATSPDAPVIEITATGVSAAHSADLANAVANSLSEYGSTRKSETHVSLALLAGATTPLRPSSPKPPMELIVGAAGGLLIGGLAVLAGVGRSSTVLTAEPEPAAREEEAEEPRVEEVKYQMAEVEAEEPQGELERFMGIVRSEPPRAITSSYRSAVTPAYLVPDLDDNVEGHRIVGRAVVRTEENQ
jgi:capsular polysaccharide biosynthesis protein